MAKEAVAVAADKTDPQTWGQIRRWYVQANRADTESAEPLIRYYTSFGAAKQQPSASAEKGLLYAYALAPHDQEVRWLATKVLLRQGKAKDARIAIAPIAYALETGDAGERYRAILTAIDTKGAAAALADIEKFEADAKAKQKAAAAKASANVG
jgi:hypothetical protein